MGSVTSKSGTLQLTWKFDKLLEAVPGASIKQEYCDVKIEATVVSSTKRVCTVNIDHGWSKVIERMDIDDGNVVYMLGKIRRRSSAPSFKSIAVVIQRETPSHLTWNNIQCYVEFTDGGSIMFTDSVPSSFPDRYSENDEMMQVGESISLASQLLFNMERDLKRMTLQFAAEISRLLPVIVNE